MGLDPVKWYGWKGEPPRFNPWYLHPALRAPVPRAKLPPARAWTVASKAGFTYPDGSGTPAAREEALLAANPGGGRRGGSEWAEGPSPPLRKTRRGPLAPPGDAAAAVYLWLTEQAVERVEAIRAHVKTGIPSPEQIALRFRVKLRTVAGSHRQKGWIQHAIEQVGGRRYIDRLYVPVPQPFRPSELIIASGDLYFGSGTQQSPGEVEGFARLAERFGGFGIGIEVNACGRDCLLALDLVAGRGVPLFVDSGAFPEFECLRRGGSPDDCEIGPEEWERRLRNVMFGSF